MAKDPLIRSRKRSKRIRNRTEDTTPKDRKQVFLDIMNNASLAKTPEEKIYNLELTVLYLFNCILRLENRIDKLKNKDRVKDK